MFESRQNFLVVDDLAVKCELRQASCRGFEFGDVIEDDEARPSQAPGKDFPLGPRAGGNGRPGGIGGRATLDDPSAQAHGADGGVGDGSAGVVEEDVVAIRACLADRRRKIGGVAIVDDGLVTVAGLCERGFLGRAGKSDSAATRDLCELPDKTSHAAGRGRYQDMLARLWVAKTVQGEIGGEAVDAEQAQICAERKG